MVVWCDNLTMHYVRKNCYTYYKAGCRVSMIPEKAEE